MEKKKIIAKDVTLEANLLKIMTNKENYTKYISFIDLKRTLPNTKTLLLDYQKYFDLYPEAVNVDLSGDFYTQFSQSWHNKDLEAQDIDYYRDYVFPAIEKSEGTDGSKVLLGLINKEHSDNMAKACSDGKDVNTLRQIIDTYEKKLQQINQTEDKEVHTIENADFEILDKAQGLPWFLPSLQQSLMSISDGQFIGVSADFGTGKTAFVISQAVHTFKHLHKNKDKRPILYFNSEGTASDVLGRFLSNLYKDKIPGGFEEIVDRRVEVKEKFLKAFDPNMFKVIQISDVPSFNAVKKKILQYKPALAIIDICDKLAPDEDVLNLKKLYDNLRVLAGAECPIIGTSQSGDTSYFDKDKNVFTNKKWLGDHDLYGSKTGKGGACDSIITIGKEENSPLRYVSVVKLKRGTPARITCELTNKFSDYKEIIW